MKKQNKTTGKNKQTPKLSADEMRFNSLWTDFYDNRKSACFWNGGDWADRWAIQRKFAWAYYEDVDQSKGYKSNVKSPEIVGRVQSTLQKMARFNLTFVARPKNERARFTAEVNQILLNEKFKDGQFRYRLRDSYADAVTNGTAILGVDWLTMKRKVKLHVSNPDDMTEEQLKAYKEKKIIPQMEATMIDYDDVALRNYRLENVFIDPAALSINIGETRAGAVFVIELITWDRWKTLYLKRQGFENTEDVVKESSDINEEGERDEKDSFLAEPYGIDGDYVVIKKMYDYDSDLYMIKANNQFIYKGPLPYNDKKIPLALLRAYKAPYQLYGIGLPDLLIPIVTQQELLSNSLYDYAMYTANPMFGVAANEYSEISTKYAIADGAPGTLLPMQNPGMSMQPIKFASMSVDIYQALQRLDRDAVIASQQDPSQLGFMKKGATATANIMNKEITEAYVMSMIDNFQEDLEEVAKMVVSRMHQFMTAKDVSKLIEGRIEEEQEMEYKQMPIEGKDVEIDWDTRQVTVKDAPGQVSFVDIRPELYKYETEDGKTIEVTPNDYDISLSVESIEILSRALEKQEAGEVLSQLSPFMVDVTNPGKVANHPMPLVDATSVMEEVFNKKGWNKKHLLQYSKLNEDAISRAKAQNYDMWRGVFTIAHPGESREHISVHTAALKEFTKRFETLNKEIQSAIVAQAPISPEYKQEFDMNVAAMQALAEHIQEDSMPIAMDAMNTVQKAQSMTQVQAPMPQGMGQMVSQSGIGGNAPVPEMGNPIAQAGMQGGPGQLGGLQ